MSENRCICEHCFGWTLPDDRGNCRACGALKRPGPGQLIPKHSPGTVWDIGPVSTAASVVYVTTAALEYE